MALKGKLQIDGSSAKFTLEECEYRLSQGVDTNGKPNTGVCGGVIIATIVTPAEGIHFFDWLICDGRKKDGIISLVTNVNDKNKTSYRFIHFKEAYCVNLYEYFNSHNSTMMTTRVTISARSIFFTDGTGTGIGMDNNSKALIDASQGLTTPLGDGKERIYIFQ
jgi:hypothetical protein